MTPEDLTRSLEDLEDAGPPVYAGPISPRCELWRRGNVMFALPIIVDTDPPDVKEIVARRRAAVLDPRGCPCGAVPVLDTSAGDPCLQIIHEHGCVASQPHHLVPMSAAVVSPPSRRKEPTGQLTRQQRRARDRRHRP
jgi:hypothetical protein